MYSFGDISKRLSAASVRDIGVHSLTTIPVGLSSDSLVDESEESDESELDEVESASSSPLSAASLEREPLLILAI